MEGSYRDAGKMRPELMELLPGYIMLLLPLSEFATSGPPYFLKDELVLTWQNNSFLSYSLIAIGDGAPDILETEGSL